MKKGLRVGEQSCGEETDFLSQMLVEMLQNETIELQICLSVEEAEISPSGTVSCCGL